ncbi:hypothetical protein PENTCL1PPCAC_21712, partial [Pristionchus entomophagus]
PKVSVDVSNPWAKSTPSLQLSNFEKLEQQISCIVPKIKSMIDRWILSRHHRSSLMLPISCESFNGIIHFFIEDCVHFVQTSLQSDAFQSIRRLSFNLFRAVGIGNNQSIGCNHQHIS